jgi:hypothetical protein
MRRLSGLGRRDSDRHIRRESTSADSLSCSDAVGEASCAELFTIIACSLCILITFTVAFFLPEIATSWDKTITSYAADERTSPVYERRFRGVNWRNSTGSACSMACLIQGHGNIYIQPFARSIPQGKKDSWTLSNVVKRLFCDVESEVR